MTTIEHDGTYAVGTDILPGRYVSEGPVDNGTCYWKRLSSLDGSDNIIDNALSRKPQVVQIDASDEAFKTDGCQPWLRTDSVTAESTAPEDIPALIAKAKLFADIATLNANARSFGAGQVPGP